MLELPQVVRCGVEICFYNVERKCHAPAINIGDSHPTCDTFTPREKHICRLSTGMVGACQISACRWNAEMTCTAMGISVAYHTNHADCDTYEPAK